MPVSSISILGAITSPRPALWRWTITTAHRDCHSTSSRGLRPSGAKVNPGITRQYAVQCQSSCFAMPEPLLLLQEINLTFGGLSSCARGPWSFAAVACCCQPDIEPKLDLRQDYRRRDDDSRSEMVAYRQTCERGRQGCAERRQREPGGTEHARDGN